MRKGITPVISIIILLLITISLAGAGWTYMSGYYEAMTAKSFSIVDIARNYVLIRNDGTGSIGDGDLTLMVDGEEAVFTLEPTPSLQIVRES